MKSKERPCLGIHTVTIGDKQIKIFVCWYVEGDTSAFMFKFQNRKEVTFLPKSHLRYMHLMQYFTEDLSDEERLRLGITTPRPTPGWGVKILTKPLNYWPVENPSWETTGKIYNPI